METKNNRMLLEPDRSLLDKQLLFMKEDESIEDFMIHPPTEQQNKWTMIKPLPGFCVKLRRAAPDGGKVFINICKTDEMPAPEEISETELMKILGSDEPSSYRVPMSIGEEREDLDKSGNPCSVFDIVINSTFYKKVETSKLFRTFVLTATLEALEDKYGLALQKEEFIVLKGRKCKGGMTKHRIQVRNKPLVEMLPGDGSKRSHDRKTNIKIGAGTIKKPLITEIESSECNSENKEKSVKEPPYIIQWLSSETNERNTIVAEFLLKEVLLGKEIELDVGEDRILLQTTKYKYFVDVFLPHLIDQEKTTANFSVENKVLKVVMPLVS